MKHQPKTKICKCCGYSRSRVGGYEIGLFFDDEGNTSTMDSVCKKCRTALKEGKDIKIKLRRAK